MWLLIFPESRGVKQTLLLSELIFHYLKLLDKTNPAFKKKKKTRNQHVTCFRSSSNINVRHVLGVGSGDELSDAGWLS